MPKALWVYIFVELGIILLALGYYIFWGNRYRKNHGTQVPPGFEKTEEVNIDPKTNKKLRVYYNPRTGERFYSEEAQ